MTAQTIFYIILWLFVFEFIFSKTLNYLNTLYWSEELPDKLKGIYDEKEYKKSMNYEKVKHNFSNIAWIFSFIVMFFVLVFWWFGYLDEFIRNFSENDIILALYFFWIIVIIQTIISLPFSYYSNFGIEEKFWFNKMTKKIFFVDIIKSL